MLDDEKVLIARFLRSNNYSEALKAFLKEAGLPPNTGDSAEKGALTLEKLLQEKRAFDIAVSFEKLNTDGGTGWVESAPSTPSVVKIPSTSNILNVAVIHHQLSSISQNPFLISSTADRRLNTTDCSKLRTIDTSHNHEAPILSIASFSDFVLHGDMAGNVGLTNLRNGDILDRRKDHQKYVVRIAVSEEADGVWIATAGWDAKIFLYWQPSSRRPPCLLDPVGKAELPSNPEAILFVRSPDSNQPTLLVSRRDSTFLYYFGVPDSSQVSEGWQTQDLELLGKQNLAPHALSWVSFTPADIALCPTDPTKVAVATSSMPHMKVLLVRLLFPNSSRGSLDRTMELSEPSTTRATGLTPSDQGAQGESTLPVDAASGARAQIALQDREEAALLISCNTMAPQTQYSTPVVVWRPNGSGVFVSGDDGIIRGIEALSGKVVCKLEAHEAGSKIRCLWAGNVRLNDDADDRSHEEEWLVSGGFDQNLIVWK